MTTEFKEFYGKFLAMVPHDHWKNRDATTKFHGKNPTWMFWILSIFSQMTTEQHTWNLYGKLRGFHHLEAIEKSSQRDSVYCILVDYE